MYIHFGINENNWRPVTWYKLYNAIHQKSFSTIFLGNEKLIYYFWMLVVWRCRAYANPMIVRNLHFFAHPRLYVKIIS